MAAQEVQTLFGIAPFQNFDRLLTRAPAIHFTLVCHVKIDGVASCKRPTVIFHAVVLSGREQTKDRPGRPARPIGRRAAGQRRTLYDYRAFVLPSWSRRQL